MFGMNENTLATMLLLVFVVYMCMHSSSALRGGAKGSMTQNFRRCKSCGFSVEGEATTCPHCSAKLDETHNDALA